ncbi:hypothetical protein I6G56_26840 [Burkholderia humptydooensis]|uniref:Uncharacterized protein n=2 Tax=Burkholderia humptydooensis TaxID=430531 RepID=A0A7U4PBG9_9BURK|nr:MULTISPECIES: hypothetical protein [Burkholderia]AJY38923.1 putative bacteriophage protein [Burkholderia sp. 2002721687]ALX46452.1 hypothetical protein AQ610_29325 [Burkholderia humptydooensis]EIP85885.1 hypothetical protein A33K_16975 [Burkholderia humptydooensis MSMB43]QPS45760.1 hypothetical protein I6G56_26840 [Burkholderia humptydooensis]
MKIPGIELSTVNPKWRMRVRPWLNMKTLKPVYSVEVHHPEFKVWLAIYAAKRGLKRFKTDEDAKEFIDGLKGRQS